MAEKEFQNEYITKTHLANALYVIKRFAFTIFNTMRLPLIKTIPKDKMLLTLNFLDRNNQRRLLKTIARLLFVILIFTGCNAGIRSKAPSTNAQHSLSKILSGFDFVGSASIRASQTSLQGESTVPKHDKEIKPLPLKIETGYQYVFHYNSAENNNKLFSFLQQRFLDQGYSIKSSDGLTNRYFGGLSFRISFSNDNVEGFIYNSMDGSLLSDPNRLSGWPSDDYILVIQRVNEK